MDTSDCLWHDELVNQNTEDSEMMTNETSTAMVYQQYAQDGIEIYVDESTGESFASIRGYARMANKNESTIRRRATAAETPLKMAEVPTPQGLRTAALIDEDTVAEWIPQDNPKLAKQLMKLGVRKLMHTLAGYEPKPKAPLALPSYAEALRQLADSLEREEKNAPKVKLANDFIARDNLVMIGDFAKDAGSIGKIKLFALLREKGILCKNNHPMQRYVDEGFFVLRPNGHRYKGRESFTTHLTPAGVEWLNRRLSQWLTK